MEKSKSPTYWNYLRVQNLLELQNGLEDNEDKVSNNELNFIIIHQVYELWFKLALKEMKFAKTILDQEKVAEEDIPRIVHHINRIIVIFDLAIQQFELMETLTPQDFIEFRGKLGTASGFQSFQMRQMEFSLGLSPKQMEILGDATALEHLKRSTPELEDGDKVWEKIETSLNEPTMKDALHNWLYRTPIDGSSPDNENDFELVSDFIEKYLHNYNSEQDILADELIKMNAGTEKSIKARFDEAKQSTRNYLYATDVSEEERNKTIRLRAAILFIESYRKLPLLAWPRTLLDKIVEMEEKLILWRARHARMVERIIGRRVGTGGSTGVDYLDATTKYRIFVNLWGTRTILLQEDKLPPLKNKDYYEFVTRH
jgi:tryptophan 2,3-dioxygenase